MSKEGKKTAIDLIMMLLMLGFGVALMNPFDWFMFSQIEMIVLAIFAGLFAIFIALFWNEKPTDERDSLHMMFAGRIAFLVGTSVATVGIVIQSIQHDLDPWLPVVLLSMVVSKYAARVYAQYRR